MTETGALRAGAMRAGEPERAPGAQRAPGPECGREQAGGQGPEWLSADPAEGVTPDAPLQVLLLAASKVMGAFYASTVVEAEVRLSPAGLAVLRVLRPADGLKSSEVAARGLSSPGTVTSVADGLVREGYVERRRDADDRRVVRLYLTEKGHQACERYLTVAGPRWRDAFDFVSPEDEPVIRKFFVDMIEHFGELIRKERGK